MEWKGSIDSVFNIQIDVLYDIYSWQQVILGQMASLEAKNHDCSRKDVLEVWLEMKNDIRKDLIDQMYAKHGPDLTADLGLGEQNVDKS